MPRQAPIEHLIISRRRRRHEGHAHGLQLVIAGIEIVTDQRDMLDALAVELPQEFLDLAAPALALFIERYTDLPVRRRQRLGGEAGIFALDVEIADFLEVEELLIEVRPIFHAAAIHIVRQVIDQLEARAHRVLVHARQVFKVDVIDRKLVRPGVIAVDQIDDRITDAADARNVQLHRPGLHLHGLGALRQKMVIGLARIAHAETHAAGRRAMLARKIPGGGFRLIIGDQVDAALAPQLHILGAVPGDLGKAHRLENRLQNAFFRRRELDELESIEASGIVEQISHGKKAPYCVWEIYSFICN